MTEGVNVMLGQGNTNRARAHDHDEAFRTSEKPATGILPLLLVCKAQ